MAREIICLAIAVVLALGSLSAFSFAGEDIDHRENLEYWSHAVHAIVFESIDINNQIPKNRFAITTLPSPVLPLRLSASYFLLSASARFRVGDLGLPGDLSLLDVYTFRFSGKTKLKRIRRLNELANLSYSLKILNWADDSCEIEFSGIHGHPLPSVITRFSKETTTIIRIDRLYFAFTFVSAAIKADETLLTATRPRHESSIVLPKGIKEPLPEYPAELRRINKEGNFHFLAVITRDGRVNPSHGIVLECFHWFLARNALEVIFNGWEFNPGRQDSQPIDIMGEIEVSYRLGS